MSEVVSLQWLKEEMVNSTFPGRYGFSICLIPSASIYVIIGGAYDSNFYPESDVYIFDPFKNAFYQFFINGSFLPRLDHTSNFVEKFQTIVTIGGYVKVDNKFVSGHDMFVMPALDTLSVQPLNCTGSFPLRRLHTATNVGESIIVIGGLDVDNGKLKDIWMLTMTSGTSGSWSQIIPSNNSTLYPVSGFVASSAAFDNQNLLYISGGEFQEVIWTLNTQTYALTKVLEKGFIGAHHESQFIKGQLYILFGKHLFYGAMDHAWIFNPSKESLSHHQYLRTYWADFDPSAPTPRFNLGSVYVPSLDALYIIGGFSVCGGASKEVFKLVNFPLLAPPIQSPTFKPSSPTESPSAFPSDFPTIQPSDFPSESPTESPSAFPSDFPTIQPSESPSESPTESPSSPTTSPSDFPSESPTESPSVSPSESPSFLPTPSFSPTMTSEITSTSFTDNFFSEYNPRMFHSFTYVRDLPGYVMFGGCGYFAYGFENCTDFLSDIIYFVAINNANETKVMQRFQTNIPARYGHATVYLSKSMFQAVIGGQGETGLLSDVVVFFSDYDKYHDGPFHNRLDQIKNETLVIRGEGIFTPRKFHTATAISGKEILVVGGRNETHASNEVWGLVIYRQPSEGYWVELNSRISGAKFPPMFSHSTVYDSFNRVAYVTGGRDILRTTIYGSVWALRFNKWIWEELIVNQYRVWGHTSHFVGGNIYIVNGHKEYDFMRSPMIYNLSSNVLKKIFVDIYTPYRVGAPGDFNPNTKLFAFSGGMGGKYNCLSDFWYLQLSSVSESMPTPTHTPTIWNIESSLSSTNLIGNQDISSNSLLDSKIIIFGSILFAFGVAFGVCVSLLLASYQKGDKRKSKENGIQD